MRPGRVVIRSAPGRGRRFRHAPGCRRRGLECAKALTATRPSTAAARPDERHDGHAPARPVFDFERVAGAQKEVERHRPRTGSGTALSDSRIFLPIRRTASRKDCADAGGSAPDISPFMRHGVVFSPPPLPLSVLVGDGLAGVHQKANGVSNTWSTSSLLTVSANEGSTSATRGATRNPVPVK